MSGLHRLRVTELHPNLLCILCGGYYVDATTIVECLHSFCKTCIVRYLETSKFCPICDVQVHKTKPLLSIRPDKTLQDIVYKLVPGLYQNEMCRRRDFYASHPEADPLTPEDGGKDLGRWYILPDDPVSVALHPAPSSYNPKYFNLRSVSAPTHTCPSAKMSMDEIKAPHLPMKKDSSHVRYLQCPAGVSVAQLKRLLRAKFGVSPSHPLAVLTCTSEDPLSDTLTLVDVAYITSWQRTEPLQLQYRIYERASKKIKLDPESFSSEALNSNEEMPKLEPSVGNGANVSAYASLDAAGNVLEYRCAPLLQAFETNDCDTSLKKDEEKWQTETGKATTESQATSCKDCAADALSVAAAKPEEVAAPEGSCKAPASEEKTESVQPELTQGNGGENGSEAKTDTGGGGGGGGGESCDSNLQKVANVTDGNNIVDTYLTYDRAYAAAPSNGVNVGVTFIPSEVGYISPAGVPCTIIPSGSCVPVSGDCIPGGVGVPAAAAAAVCSGAALHRPLQGEAGTTDHVNVWVAAGLQNLVSEPALLTVENKPSAVDMKDGEDEGKEVQLTISESGIMSASGRGTTVEGMVNAIESEACELLSKIESGSIGEDFPPKAGEKQAERETIAEPPSVINKQSKVKDNISVPVDTVKNKVDGKGNANNKNQVCSKGATSNVMPPSGNVSAVTLKPNTTGSKDSKGAVNEKTEMETFPDNVAKKSISESQDKTSDKRTMEPRRPSDTQQPTKDPKEVGNPKDSRSTHIPASLTAASMANLNKPHLKAGPSKLSQVEEVKSQDTKPGNNGVNVRKEGKLDQSGKQLLSSGGCRKSSQPYGYRTLKTPPKSWNPTISREQLALGAGKSSSGKGLQEHVRPNKFFKNRNNPRFLGNPSAGVRPMFSNVNDNISNQQKRGVVLKLDPKTLGPVPVPVSNDIRSSGCLTSVSSSTSSVSSGQSATISTTQTTMSLVGSLPMSSDGHTAVSSLQTCNTEAAVAVAAARVEDAPVTSTKGSPTLPTSLKSVAKESTNSSSKVIGKLNTTVQESKMIHDTVKTTSSSSSSNSSSSIGSKVNNKISATAKSENMSTVQTAVSNSKVDISGQSVVVTEDKANTGTTVQVVSTVGNMVPNSNLPKPALSTAIPTCVTQLRAATINTLTPSNTSFQPQQHFTVGSPAVGIIPSCGVSLPATIGTMPLPYYTSPSLGYPTYPFVYQSPDATIGLIPTHPSASFIPAFSSCLSPRSPLSPRNIGGTKMLPDLPLQSNLLPLVPLVSQVPPQALSPRPMTPPSPRTPTSNQSPKPYPTQSPRQSSTNHSRPQTPHSPKTLSTGHTRSPVQSPKLPAGQSGKPQSGSQLTPTITQPLTQTQTSGTQVTSSSQSPNLASKLNACVQTSFSHTTIMPKNNMSFIPSKPSVPLPTKNALPSQSLGLSQQVVSVSSCYPNTSQSPKPSRPKMPQSPKLTSSVGCTLPSETLIRTGSATQPVRPATPQFAKCSTPSYSAGDTRTTSVSAPRMTVTSQDRLQIAIPQSPVFTMPLPVSQFTTAVSSGVSVAGLPVPQMSNSLEGTAMFHPQTLQVSIPHTMSALSQSVNGTGNTSMTAVSKGMGNLPEVSSTVSSFIPNSSSASVLYPHNSIQNIPPVLTTSNMTPIPAATGTPACISAVPSCTSLTQNFPFNSNASCVNPMISPLIPPPGHIPSSSAAETPKVSSVMPVVVSVGNAAVSLSGNNSTSSKVSVNNAVSTSCPAVTGVSHDVTRSVASAVSVSSSVNSLPTNTCCVSLPHSTAACSVPACSGTTTLSSTSSVTPPGMLAVTSTNNKVEELPHKVSSPIDVHKSSVANTFSLSTTASVAISPSITGSFAVPLNGTTDVMSSQCKTLNTPDSMAKSSLSPSSGVLNPSGSSDVGGKSVVMNARERGGNMPQPSACTPVCDVTHVIDAKLQCAEPSVSSSDGPRPCLKS
ncbi:serine-rich adhesin for platelets-like [Macrobrachium rosenbergii]|uniref:serine-rich adhesin for platelets-like n=1 Tax=Macrobrachium rosenbergii TaxID=79674 RepID=UPI0034D41B09